MVHSYTGNALACAAAKAMEAIRLAIVEEFGVS
jgi:adenosylmethionine-8-amino-7-oxononanoate aminotransferase